MSFENSFLVYNEHGMSRTDRDRRDRKRRRRAESSEGHRIETDAKKDNPRRRLYRDRSPDADKVSNPECDNYSIEEWAYYQNLSRSERKDIAAAEKRISAETACATSVPVRFRILMSPHIPSDVKAIALQRYASSSGMFGSESGKIHTWLEQLYRLPFGKRIPVGPPSDNSEAVAGYLRNVRQTMDQFVYGHDQVKNEIVNFVAQKIANPASKGKVLCLSGPPGIAKTHLIKHGVSRALGLPFSLIALGGANDGTYLDGHVYTYEGSRPGIIVKELMRANCNNPVIFFDELDKISKSTHRSGDEITNILLHVTDPTQNEVFRDKYFSEIPVDLSNAFIMFSCNDPDCINSVLKDRLTILHMKPYDVQQKIHICKSHLLPDITTQFNWPSDGIDLSDAAIKSIIDAIPAEDGVRTLKKTLHATLAEWMTKMMLDGKNIVQDCLPISIDETFVRTHMPSSYGKESAMDIPISVKMMYL